MKTIAIPVTIAPAIKAEIFTENEDIRDNQMYFVFKSWKGQYCGPFFTHESCDADYLVPQFNDGMLFTLAHGNEEGYSFLFDLRPAVPADLKNGKILRYGYPYYLREDPLTVDGPFLLTENTDKELLAKYLRLKAVYVPNEKQSFTPLDMQHSA
ncbi:hypothetical protein [Flavobacterium beibuense]|uniref:hypothetical protein n=1 Tax=Flavobacterium beibuense TaxID=657326 RepID=UPI003A902808